MGGPTSRGWQADLREQLHATLSGSYTLDPEPLAREHFGPRHVSHFQPVDMSRFQPANYSDPFGLSPNAEEGNGGGGCTPAKPCKIDKEKFVQWMRDNAGTKSKGRCAKFCRRGMEAGGMNTEDRPVDAADYGPFLVRHGATVVGQGSTSGSPEGYAPQNGDIVVFDRTKGYSSGHIQVWIGDQWASDFKQGTQFIPKKGINWGYTIYRLP